MEYFLSQSSQQEVAWKVLVVRVRFNDFIALSGDKRLASNESLSQTHVDMVSPQNSATVKTVTDERHRIVGKLSFCHNSCIAGVSPSV
jgi:hypothetical protein